jgi:hypothetical protein
VLTKLPRRIKSKPAKHRSLFDYLQQGKNSESQDGSGRKNEKISINVQNVLAHKTPSKTNNNASNTKSIGDKSSSGEDILSLLSILDKKNKAGGSVPNSIETTISEPKTIEVTSFRTTNIIDVSGSIADVDLGTLKLPTGRVLDEILEYGLGKDDVVCYSNGSCSDGVSVGETYTDKYGFLRQRGFVNTTRVTIYTDWIVEKGVVKKILPKAYGLKTNRGAVALVPEDYLCELEARYWIKLLNYDKCKNYRAIIEWGSKSRSGKRRKRR